MRTPHPLTALTLLAVGLVLTTAPSAPAHAAAHAESRSGHVATRGGDPNARRINKLVRRVNEGHRARALDVATSDVVHALFGYHRDGAVFGRAKLCDVTGPLRPAAASRSTGGESLVNCQSTIRVDGSRIGSVELSYQVRGDRTIFRAYFDVPGEPHRALG